MTRVLVIAISLVLTGFFARGAQAAPIVIGAPLFASGGDVIAAYIGAGAAFTSDLYVFDASDLTTPLAVTAATGPGFGGAPGAIFLNSGGDPSDDPASGATVNLGSFLPGTELVFGIFVRDTGFAFYTGPGSRNPDGLPHAAVDFSPASPPIPPGMVAVGFEDLFGGGDLDFDDLGFAFSNVTQVPEPASMFLLGTGIAGMAVRSRRRTQRK